MGRGRIEIMRCQQVQALFSEWQEQHLEPSLAVRMQAHLDRCPRCARELQEFQATCQVLHRLPEVEPPSDFVARTLAALPFPSRVGPPAPLRLPGALWRWVGVGGALLALLAVGILTFRLWTRSGSDNGASRIATIAPLLPAVGPGPSVQPVPPQPPGPKERRLPQGGPGGGRRAAPRRLNRVGSRRPGHPRLTFPAPMRKAPEPFDRILAQAQRSPVQAPSDRLRATGYRQLARAYQASYRLSEALQALAQARRLDPQGTPPGDGLAQQVLAEARALLAEGQAEEAAQLSQALLTYQEGLEEQQAAAVALIARCQAVQGQPELEQVTWARLAQQFPASKSSSGALWQVARSQEQSGNAPEAVATYQQLIAQSSQEKEGWLLQARALKRAADLNARHGGDRQAVVSQYAAARELFKRALREAPEAPPVQDGTILLEMAQVQEALQQKQEAIATYVELLQQHPNTDSARRAEARLEELI